VLVAAHPAGSKLSPVGKVREGTVYEQFFTTLPSSAFTPADVLDLSLHRGSFETVLADEDEEQASDRWVSRTQWGQEGRRKSSTHGYGTCAWSWDSTHRRPRCA
jgi:hypothetical protein